MGYVTIVSAMNGVPIYGATKVATSQATYQFINKGSVVSQANDAARVIFANIDTTPFLLAKNYHQLGLMGRICTFKN